MHTLRQPKLSRPEADVWHDSGGQQNEPHGPHNNTSYEGAQPPRMRALRHTQGDIMPSRFKPDDDDLRGMIAWHAEITVELQRRVLAAQVYLRGHRNDPELMAILEGKTNDA